MVLVPADLKKKLSDVVDKEVVKKDVHDQLVKNVNAIDSGLVDILDAKIKKNKKIAKFHDF